MKLKYIFAYSLSCISVFCLQAKEIPVKQLCAAQSRIFKKPLMIDQTNNMGEKFASKDFFSSLSLNESDFKTDILADSAGFFRLPVPEKNHEISYYRFYIESDRYCHLRLDVKSGCKTSISVNQKSSNAKTSKDSLNQLTKYSSNIQLEPNAKNLIELKFLTTSKSEQPRFSIQLVTEKNDSAAVIRTDIAPSHKITVEDIMTGERIIRCSISEDGSYILASSRDIDNKGERRKKNYLFEVSSGQLISQLDGKNRYEWMPKSNKLYYTETIDGKMTLHIINPENLRDSVICSGLPSDAFKWSYTEDYLIFNQSEEYKESKNDLSRILTPDDRQPGWRTRYNLSIYNIKEAMLSPITFGFHNITLEDVHQDGKHLIFSKQTDCITEREISKYSFYELDVETMTVDTLLENAGYINGVRYTDDSQQLLISGSGDAFNGIGLKIRKNQISNSFNGELFLLQRNSATVTPITKDFAPSVTQARWNHYNNMIYLLCEDKDYETLYSYNPKNGEFTRLNIETDTTVSFDLASHSAFAVYAGNSTSYPDQLYSLNLQNMESRLLLDPQKQKADNYELGEVKDWSFRSNDGSVIDGRYYLPADFNPEKKYPMLVYYYGGTSPTGRNFFHPYSMHLYAAQGYVVYVIQPSGTTGWGQEFAARHVNGWGKQAIDDIIMGVKEFCRQHTFVNDKKVGCMGASYGGYTTMYLQTQTDIFAAAVSHAGISSISSYWGEGFWGYSYSSIASAGSFPWNNYDLYVKRSPLFNAEKIKTPILLLHGKADTNVPIGESIQMFTALKLLGKQVDFVTVEGENHGISNFQKRLEWKKTIFAYLAKWLKDEPQWWETLYPESELEK